MAIRIIDDAKLQNIAVAIQAKDNGGQMTVDEMAGRIEAIPSGGGTLVEEKDVNFYDYDGTLLYSYTLDEIKNLEELPPFSEHRGLVPLYWNWDYEDVIALTQPMDIGMNYTTDNGKTKIYFEVPYDNFEIAIQMTVNGKVAIDWGDSTPEEYIEAAQSLTNAPEYKIHTYTTSGLKILSIDQIRGWICGGYTEFPLFTSPDLSLRSETMYNALIKKIEFGNINIGYGTFNLFGGTTLESVSSSYKIVNDRTALFTFVPFYSMPKGQTLFIGGACLKTALNNNITTLNANGGFNSNSYIKNVKIPNSVTSIGTQAFYGCRALTKIKIPNSVTSIGTQAFYECTSLFVIDLTDFTNPQFIPTLANANAFQGIPAQAQYQFANQTMLDAFAAATNWSTLSSKFIIKGTN